MPHAIEDLKARAAQAQSAIDRLALLRPPRDPETGLSMRQSTTQAAEYREAVQDTLDRFGGVENLRLAMGEGVAHSEPALGRTAGVPAGSATGSLSAADLAAAPVAPEPEPDLSIDSLKARAAGIGDVGGAEQAPSLESLRARIRAATEQVEGLPDPATVVDTKPMVDLREGGQSFERTITVTEQGLNAGRPTNIPTIWGGQQLSDDQAVAWAINSGARFPSYDTIDEAVQVARQRSQALGQAAGMDPGGHTPEQPQALYTPEDRGTLQQQAARFREALKGGVPYIAKPVGEMGPEEAGYRGFGANLVGGAAGLGADVLKTLGIAPETAQRLERTRRGAEVLGQEYARVGGAQDLIDAYNQGWEPFFDAVRYQLGQVPGMAGLAMVGGGLAGVPGAAATFTPLSYTEIRGATERAGLDPEQDYTIPGTDIRLKGRSFNLIMTVPHAAVEVFGVQRLFGGKNFSLIRAFIEELGEEAVQYLIAEMNVEAQKNPELAPFVEAMSDPDKLTAAAREMVNAIPQVAVLTGLGAATQRMAEKAEPVTAAPRIEPTIEPRQPAIQEREFTGQIVREPGITPEPPGVPAERG